LNRAQARKNWFASAKIDLGSAPNNVQHGKIFCTEQFFLQKRVAQFQQLRTTNHQVTSVFTYFKFQKKRTPGRSFD
jgi:hypothetical protein